MKFFLGRFGMQIITNQFQKELKQHGNEQFPFLVSYQKLSEYESGSFMWHWHPEIEITYVQKGTMCYKVNHMVYHLKEGDIVFNNSGALHSGTMENQKDCAYIPDLWIFPKHCQQQICRSCHSGFYAPCHLYRPE